MCATVFNTEQWKGIHVECANGIFPARNPGRIIIRNSRASNIAGDGITIYACSNGLIENNVSYDIGTASTAAVGTPNAIWTWACADCIVQFNEGFRSHSPARDGGIFDIDWGNAGESHGLIASPSITPTVARRGRSHGNELREFLRWQHLRHVC